MLRELRGALTALALVVCGVLVAVSYDFGIPGQALLQSLRFHIAAALLGLIVLMFIGGAWLRGLLFAFALAISVGQGVATIFHQQEARLALAATSPTPLFKLLSFNLLAGNQNGETIAKFIAGSGADVAMLMEAAPIANHAEILRAAYPYYAGCDDGSRCGGVVILSRTPLADITVQSMSGAWQNRLVTASTTIDAGWTGPPTKTTSSPSTTPSSSGTASMTSVSEGRLRTMPSAPSSSWLAIATTVRAKLGSDIVGEAISSWPCNESIGPPWCHALRRAGGAQTSSSFRDPRMPLWRPLAYMSV